jgi:DNA-binding MarR family transcriptional regulator
MANIAASSDPNQRLPELASGIGFRINRIARALRRSWACELEEFELTPQQAVLLRALSEDPGCSLRCLSRRVQLDAMSTKRSADELESRGLLRSAHRGADRRPRQLELTSNGAQLAHTLRERALRREALLQSALGREDLAALVSAFDTLESLLGIDDQPTSETDQALTPLPHSHPEELFTLEESLQSSTSTPPHEKW